MVALRNFKDNKNYEFEFIKYLKDNKIDVFFK